MAISDFGQVSRRVSKRLQKGVRAPNRGRHRLKVAKSPCCAWISKVNLVLKSCAQCARRKSYEMNKCLSLVHLITNWIAKWFAHDPPLVARNARLGGADPSIAIWITSGLPTIRTESSHLAVNRGILTHAWRKKSRTSEFRQVFRCGSAATQKCNGNYQYKDQQTQQTKFNHRRVENAD